MFTEIYKKLFKSYGPQGWWPLLDHKGINPTKTGAINGYHPRQYDFPQTEQQRFEICVGAILTQNTSWIQVEKALQNLAAVTSITSSDLKSLDEETMKNAIKPAGYFNQKTKKLLLFIEFYESLHGRTPTRDELLAVWGIGRETADSILLYAFNIPTFVVDAYTRRIFSATGLIDKNADYNDIQKIFEDVLLKDVAVYQEFHALIVEHAKRYCKTKPDCEQCILRTYCH
ncbi:MAG: endonuclease III domain-containing protein [Candidatus Woesearchaeota archaeon]|jgi:endonuclease-3 related protein